MLIDWTNTVYFATAHEEDVNEFVGNRKEVRSSNILMMLEGNFIICRVFIFELGLNLQLSALRFGWSIYLSLDVYIFGR